MKDRDMKDRVIFSISNERQTEIKVVFTPSKGARQRLTISVSTFVPNLGGRQYPFIFEFRHPDQVTAWFEENSAEHTRAWLKAHEESGLGSAVKAH